MRYLQVENSQMSEVGADFHLHCQFSITSFKLYMQQDGDWEHMIGRRTFLRMGYKLPSDFLSIMKVLIKTACILFRICAEFSSSDYDSLITRCVQKWKVDEDVSGEEF